MTIVHEFYFSSFEPWGGAVETWRRIENADKVDLLEQIIDDTYCDRDTMTDTELNDLLWFESDAVFEWLGMKTDWQIEEEKREKEARLTAARKLIMTNSAYDFCVLWTDLLEQNCTSCPLYYCSDCADDAALITCSDAVLEAAKRLYHEIENEEDE